MINLGNRKKVFIPFGGINLNALPFPDKDKVSHPNPQERYKVWLSGLETYPIKINGKSSVGISGRYSTQAIAPYQDEYGNYHFPQPTHYRFSVFNGKLSIRESFCKWKFLDNLFNDLFNQ